MPVLRVGRGILTQRRSRPQLKSSAECRGLRARTSGRAGNPAQITPFFQIALQRSQSGKPRRKSGQENGWHENVVLTRRNAGDGRELLFGWRTAAYARTEMS